MLWAVDVRPLTMTLAGVSAGAGIDFGRATDGGSKPPHSAGTAQARATRIDNVAVYFNSVASLSVNDALSLRE